MKVTLNWLKQYVDFHWTADELSERLTMLGLEVENVRKISGAFEGVVVAQILTRDPVPGSDKLSVCKVNDGKGERTIICGAQNHKPGDKVPLILPNFSLPLKAGDKEPFVIKERKVFGITSQGMMCSPQELGLPDAVDGLLILPADAPVGKPLGEYLGRSGGDVVYDLEVTPNRPDLNSVIGIAREISALTRNPLRQPVLPEDAPSAASALPVRVEVADLKLCPRYIARVIQGVKVGPSPAWLRETLEKVGIRSISNIVDITNYVMMETGQPLHAFDYHLISKPAGGVPTIEVRMAAPNEKFITLDCKERTLTDNMLLIADKSKPVALAGIMGGANTEINERTVDVLVESANFSPANIRRTSKRLELRSESSYRFERGVAFDMCNWASRRAVQLILQTAGGRVSGGSVDVHASLAPPIQITLRYAKTDALLGVKIAHADQLDALARLGLSPGAQTSDGCVFSIPSWRMDLKREVDLMEEIGRLYGVDNIPSTGPRGALGANTFDAVYDQIATLRRCLAGLGLNEAQGQSLISKTAPGNLPNDAVVGLANPLSSDMDMLRPSLLPGLLTILHHNASRQNHDVELFEVGRVFHQGTGGVKEENRLAIAITGMRAPKFWAAGGEAAGFEIYDLKGLVESMLEHFGLRDCIFSRRSDASVFFVESADVSLGGKVSLGQMGQLQPSLGKKYDLRHPVFLAEFNLDEMLRRRNATHIYKALPQFPSSRRDVAIVVSESTTHDQVLQSVKKARAANLETVELFDIFRGKNVALGHKSMAYGFTYRAADKTLTDAEVNSSHTKVVESLKNELSATIRE